MGVVIDNAVTLTVSDYSETSQIVSLFTEHNGKVRTIAKGAKRPKSRLGGPIDKLQLVEAALSIRSRNGLGQLTELTQTEVLSGLHENLDAFYAASYIVELVILGTEDLDPQPLLYKNLIDTLRRLSCGSAPAILVYCFEARLLRLLGLMPELAMCVTCRRKRAQGQEALFSPLAGGVLCRECAADSAQDGVAVTGKALDALLFLVSADNEQVDRVRLTKETAEDMRKLLRQYWPHVLGRSPKAGQWICNITV